MNLLKDNRRKKYRRARRSSKKVLSGGAYPRLVVFRSNTHTAAQLIDDSTQKTLASASTLTLTKVSKNETKSALAFKVGEVIGKKALEIKQSKVVFDRRSYRYHGRVKAVAEGARKAGLKI